MGFKSNSDEYFQNLLHKEENPFRAARSIVLGINCVFHALQRNIYHILLSLYKKVIRLLVHLSQASRYSRVTVRRACAI
ncbi:hypothetical protein X975_04831, partial [Stegodyphus mimosarum]